MPLTEAPSAALRRWAKRPATRVAGVVLFLMLSAAFDLASGVAAPAHTALESSSPAANDTLRAPPDRITLEFTGPVDGAASAITLLSADGVSVPIDLRQDPSTPRRLVGIVRGELRGGGVRVEWRTVATDGHPVEGTFVFYLHLPAEAEGAGGLGLVESEAPPPSYQAVEEPIVPAAAALLRAAGVGALAGLAGLLAYLAWLAPGTAGGRTERLALALAWAAPILLAAHAAAWFRYVTAGFDGITPIDIFAYNLPGQVESARLALSLLALSALVLARRPGFAAAFAAAGVVVGGFMGHSMTFTPEVLVPARIVHVGALGIWLGGLLVLLATASRGVEFHGLARRVSSLALAAVVLLLVTGVAHILVFPAPVRELAASSYGKVLIAKLVGLGILIALGARNRLRLVPRLPDERAARGLRRTVGWEVAIMAAVLVATGALSYLPVPEPVQAAAAGDPVSS